MEHNSEIYYSALASCDPRFDGVFFVGVTSTGIYCRPVCTAKKPRVENCLFFDSAAAAEKESFRPCLRCRPELAPGYAPLDDGQRIARYIADEIEEGLFKKGTRLDDLANSFELSSRQIRRIVKKEFGVSPMELIMTRRLLFAKQLLTETKLPVTEIAFSSGFSSLRRFNDAFLKRYGMPPGRLRKNAASEIENQPPPDILTLHLAYRPPFDWNGLLDFLNARALPGIESVQNNTYSRTLNINGCEGWIHVQNAPKKRALLVQISYSLTPVLPLLMKRVRALFDLNARPDIIADRLAQHAEFSEAVKAHPGLRIPGAIDGYEIAVRAILGQQITVKAATTLSGRLVQSYGIPVQTPAPELTHLFPPPSLLANQSVDAIASHGIIQRRAQSIIVLSREVAEGRLKLVPGLSYQEQVHQLTELPGIGPWTANYIAMRVLQWPDAFPKEDVVIRKKLGGLTPTNAEKMSQAWRPWRSYAAMYIWRS